MSLRRSDRLISKMHYNENEEIRLYIDKSIKASKLEWGDIPACIHHYETYERCDDVTQKSIDLLLKRLFIQNGVFTACEHAEFGIDRYDGILVTTDTDSFCLSGTLLRNLNDPDYIEGYLTKEGIHWTD